MSAPGPATVSLPTIDPSRLAPLIGPVRVSALLEAAEQVRARLEGRRIVNVNSTATGGGVAELLQVLLGYARGAGIGTEWLVIRGSPDFFEITKRIHNWLHGVPGDGGALGEEERRTYERTTSANAEAILNGVEPGDVVIVHDPQPAGLVPLLVDRGALVVWRCHVGVDGRNEWTETAWAFLRRYVEPAHASVFSRAAFAPSFLAPERLAIIPPSIDPFATKNRSLPRAAVAAILGGAGLLDSSSTDGRVTRRAEILRSGGPVRAGEPVVTQISRWDGLKDMRGVLRGFVEHVPRTSDARLVLAGPSLAGVADDPEAEAVWNDAVADWESLAEPDRSRVQLVLLPLADAEENALVVNALQRHAAVVVQKSLAEGFGLTVTEAMWKSRAVVGGAVGGIVDQIVDGTSGVLVDPHDLDRFGTVVARLVDDPDERRRLGRNARARVKTKFLPDRHLRDHALLLARLLD